MNTKELVHNFENAHEGKSGECEDIISHYYLGMVMSVAVTSGNKHIVSGSSDGSIKVFGLSSTQVHHFENAHESKFVLSKGLISHCD